MKKELNHVDALGRAFIGASPFLVLATSGNAGLDFSPKGDQPVSSRCRRRSHPAYPLPPSPCNNRLDGLKRHLVRSQPDAKRYGEKALEESAARADELFAEPDHDGAAVRRRIIDAVGQLAKMKPSGRPTDYLESHSAA